MVIKLFKIIILCIIAFQTTCLFAGSSAKDFSFILRHHFDKNSAKIDTNHVIHNISEPGLFAKGLIKIYQAAISSQDSPACNFYPSCSRFSAQAIHDAGFIKGALLSADRLMRCHWFSRNYYNKYYGSALRYKSNKLYDPVRTYTNPEKHE